MESVLCLVLVVCAVVCAGRSVLLLPSAVECESSSAGVEERLRLSSRWLCVGAGCLAAVLVVSWLM